MENTNQPPIPELTPEMLQQLQIKKLIENSTRLKCECGSEFFAVSTYLHEVSRVITGTGKEEYLPVQGPIICSKCQKPWKRPVEAEKSLLIT